MKSIETIINETKVAVFGKERIVENAILMTFEFTGSAIVNGDEVTDYEFDNTEKFFIKDTNEYRKSRMSLDDARSLMIKDLSDYLTYTTDTGFDVIGSIDVTNIDVSISEESFPIDLMLYEDRQTLIENSDYREDWMQCKVGGIEKFAKRVLVLNVDSLEEVA